MALNQSEFQKLLAGEIELVSPGKRFEPSMERPLALFPGSFNPIHSGHLQMAKIARQQFGLDVWYELSVENVEKKTLNWAELDQRLSQSFCQPSSRLLLTKAATFEEKLRLFPRAVFVVGVDTLLRINDVRFYRDRVHRADAFTFFQSEEASFRFLVFGRWHEDQFLSGEFEIANQLRRLCQFVPQSMFDVRISSTQIRTGNGS